MLMGSETLIFKEKTYRSKNRPRCENAVARTHRSWMLWVMGSKINNNTAVLQSNVQASVETTNKLTECM